MVGGHPALLRSKPPLAAANGEAGILVRRDAACAEIFLPAAPVATVTSGVIGWGFGAWVNLGTPTNDFMLRYQHIVNYATVVGMVDSTFELAYGVGKTALDAMRGMAPLFNPGPITIASLPLSMMEWPVISPAGQAIFCRAADSAAIAYNYETALLGWDNGLPDFDTIPLASINGPGYWLPANTGAGFYQVAKGAGWIYGADTQVQAAAPNDLLVVGIKPLNLLQYLINSMILIQVGYGASGSETWVATMTSGRTWDTRWLWPPVLIKAGERWALRAADAAAGAEFFQVKVYDV